LRLANTRTIVDRREGLTPGFKFNDWEMRGVPLRIEIGPKDIDAGQAVLARRDLPGREGKQEIALEKLETVVERMLTEIQESLYERAVRFSDENTHHVESYDEFKEVLADQGGFIRNHWAGTSEDEAQIKEETKATIRCLPIDRPEGKGRCFFTGQETDQVAVFAKGY